MSTTTTTSSTPTSFKEKLEKSRRRYQGSRASRTKHVFNFEKKERQDELYAMVSADVEDETITDHAANLIDHAINTAGSTFRLDEIKSHLKKDDENALEAWIATLPLPPGYTEPVATESKDDDATMTNENDLSKIGNIFETNANKTPKSNTYTDPVDRQNAAAAKALAGGQGAKKKTNRTLVLETPDKSNATTQKAPVTVTRKRPIETVANDDDNIDESELSPEEIEIVRAGEAVKKENPDLFKEQSSNLCERCFFRKQKAHPMHPRLKLCSNCDRLWHEKEMRKEAAGLREEQKKKDLRDATTVKKYEMLKARIGIRNKTAKLRKLNEEAE